MQLRSIDHSSCPARPNVTKTYDAKGYMMADVINRSELEESLNYLTPSPKAFPAIVRGKGATIEDIDGRTYFDFEGGPGVVSVGHCHPAVVEAVRRQSEILLQGPGKYLNPMAPSLAKRIAKLTGEKQKRVFFMNSGSEANDGAIKLALKYAGKRGKEGFGIVAFEHAFHGRGALTLALTGVPSMKKGFGPYGTFPGVVHISPPYTYRCPYGSKTPEEAGNRAVQAFRDAIRWRAPGDIAVMIAEPILGLSGVIVPPDNYWPQIAEICDEHGITLIMDEVFVGFARTGKIFAHQHWNINPSIVTFAKAIGGGLPLGGFIARDEVALAFGSNDHNTTFGSNNMLGLAAGHAVLDIIEEERLADRAEKSGNKLMEHFRRLQSRYAFVGDVRGLGMVIGIEIVTDRDSKTPAAEVAKSIQTALRENGVIAGVSGVYGNVLRLSPVLNMTDDEIGQSLEAFDNAFATVARA
jgi:4-aminobutyrate aminotransferase / (S)-3-amino-2-methylpropionate transaminase / 5-aminovalerate transaminase